MKLCPYCSKTLTDQALACKYCGEWLEDISDYLIKKGSVYAGTDSMILPHNVPSAAEPTSNQEKNTSCVFCGFTSELNDTEYKEKNFTCKECGKVNMVTGRHIDDVMMNIKSGWGWIILTVYFSVAIQKYLFSLDDTRQIVITFSTSLASLLAVYFLTRNLILKERYLRKKSFGNLFNASLVSGAVSTVGAVMFVFLLHMVYPFSGLQSDRKETNMKVYYYKSKIKDISGKQKEITDAISKPVREKKEAAANVNLLETYIKLNNEEKLYADSIYTALGESDYYSGINENVRKLKEANLLTSKIITYKNMSAQNLKNYYLSGNENAFKTVQELNSEISKLSKEYNMKYNDLFLED